MPPPPPPPRPSCAPQRPLFPRIAAEAEVTFNSALARPAAERAAFVAQACGNNDALLAEVKALLKAHDAAEGFMDDDALLSPEIEQQMARLKPEEEGEMIGPYKLREQIGEGGFGAVWVADQDKPVRRRVALKIIKMGMDTAEVIARFEQERQALAMMDHPNIAKVFDAGATEHGRPFFVMELVRGVKITDYCDDQQLSTRERIELFITVCQAVQHAHQKGIIHRDLKPSNILVTINDGKAVPKVIDFGVAKATQGRLTDQTVYTQFQQMIGTPLYMSPEQAEMTSLDIDTRSDIYALGVLLYELLTGHTPIEQDTLARVGLDEIRRLIREVDPPRPSMRVKTLDGAELTTAAKRRNTEPAKLPGALRGDLDWIVMKCIEKDRARRYDTANGLALDLQRHLKNEVIIARPPTTGYLLSKLIKRNKSPFIAGSAVVLTLMFGFAVAVWQARRANLALDELRATAPAFAEQAHGLAAKEQFGDAIAKLDYAIKLRPNAAEYLVAKGDLLQCQFRLAEAAAVYREALRVKPGLARAEASAKLCDELLAAPPTADGKLTRESLAKLHLAMQQQQRPAAELLPVARLLGEEKKLLVDYWLARLKDLPVSAEKPLKDRLTVREDGLLKLDLGNTKVADLSPLGGAPVGELYLSSTGVASIEPLRELRTLIILHLANTKVIDLSPLRGLPLEELSLEYTAISDLSPLRGMRLRNLNLYQTPVADLSPLAGMPLSVIDLSNSPVLDFSPLAGWPLEKCYLQQSRIRDLSVLRGKPLKKLVLWGCADARGYAVLSEFKDLELLLLPAHYRLLPNDDFAAIAALRGHPRLRQIGSEIMPGMQYSATSSREEFWQDWDREQSFVGPLRQAGIKFELSKRSKGTYYLYITNQPLRDLSMLKGAPISSFTLDTCPVTDLTPLHGLPLESLGLFSDYITDLSPLRGMPLKTLTLFGSYFSDLSPLRDLPLRTLYLDRCVRVIDVGVIGEIATLENLTVPVQATNIEALRKLSKVKKLGFTRDTRGDGEPVSNVDEFWKHYRWISQLRASGIKPRKLHQQWDGGWEVDLSETGISDLTVIQGALINILHLWETPVADLTPLRGMRLRNISLFNTKVTDLSPLAGMPLEDITLSGTKVSDISALRGMKLNSLTLHDCPQLTDLSPLAESKELATITLPPNATNIEFLRAFPKLKRIGFKEDYGKQGGPDKSAVEFWKHYDVGWARALRASNIPIKTFKERPDGTFDVDLSQSAIQDLAILRGAAIRSLYLWDTRITDLTPLRGMPLTQLSVFNTQVTDLSPLKGMPLETLTVSGTKVADLSALRGMPLKSLRLHDCQELTDLSPLAECKELKEVTLPPKGTNLESLRALPKLERIGIREDSKNGYRPEKTAAEFWQEYDAKKQSTTPLK